MASTDTYTSLIALLDEHGAQYRLIDHPPEGRTEYVLGVVPGNARVDLTAVKALLNATYVSFASPDIAERLAGSVTGTVLPFAFSPELELIVDPSLLENDELYFNAARLDRSVVLNTRDYLRLAKPRIEGIAERPTA
jgi:Ala-tRNA(Pro) deacylase